MTRSSFGGSSPFDIDGAPIARDAFAADIGIDFALSGRVWFGVAYNSDIARRAESHSGRATFS
ncbi:hypothetical protein CDQ91_11845 [Sphingopyxis witflariensis]|uniref:Autotransporter domain-containing protein n=1 Tax=Sphingopyxis witflariensis TaxID=173675 RepID=A0A246JUK1_9SPHN|nr:hypothetical protein CDQ91_11845 [Sphingopyxis witflariensis]